MHRLSSRNAVLLKWRQGQGPSRVPRFDRHRLRHGIVSYLRRALFTLPMRLRNSPQVLCFSS